MFRDEERFLFEEWIAPVTMRDFADKDVLECGCGGGQHTSFVAPYARLLTAVDLNTADIARERNKALSNVTFVEADLGTMNLGRQFDVVYCIGVIHHTDDPDATFRNIWRH
jgi:2-polyprenyl-3-methyl-5-hydroxy-6-metoxy-1,4-benzoquinol methylase